MKSWTIVGIYANRADISAVNKSFVHIQDASTVEAVERDFVARSKYSRIAAIFEGDHVSLLGAEPKYWPEKSAASFGAKGWTIVGIEQKNRQRFVHYSRDASIDAAKDACGRLYGSDCEILAAIAGSLRPSDIDRGPIALESKTWTVCGIWELADKPEPFTDTIVAADAEEAEFLISEKQPTLTIAGVFEGDHTACDAGRAVKRKTPTAWTVVGVIQSSGQRYAETVEADSWMSAHAICEAANGDLAIAAVLEGRLEAADAKPAVSPSFARP